MKGLHIVSDFDELQLLSNRLAYRILLELQKGPASGAQIAELFGIKSPRVNYYLKKLEKYGLAERVKHKPLRGNREKFYQATAREYLISAGCSESVSPEINASISNSYLDHFLINVMDIDLDSFVSSIIDDYLRVKPGENVIVVFNEKNLGLLKRVIIKLRQTGARYRTHLSSMDVTQHLWSSLDIDNVKTFYDQVGEEIEWADVWLNLELSSEPDISGIPDSRVKSISTIRGQIMSDIVKKSGLRSLAIYYPPFEKEFFTDRNILERMDAYWKALSVNISDYERINAIGKYVVGKGTFIIETGRSNKLEVKFDEKRYFIDAGPLTDAPIRENSFYLPSGEIALLPCEGGVNGDIFCEFCDPRIGDISGVHLKIENSIVTDVTAEGSLERLQTVFDSFGEEGRTVGQICFGMNPAVRDIELLPELAKKLYGSVHLSFGNNVMVGGTISRPKTWDLVSISPRVRTCEKQFLNEGQFDI